MNNLIQVIVFAHPDNRRVNNYYSDTECDWDGRLIWSLFEEPEYTVIVPACRLACVLA